MAFHLKDGWFFERIEQDCGVRIYHQLPGMPVDCEVVTDAFGWASVVASMSSRGETSETFGAALKAQLHELSVTPEQAREMRP